MNSLELRKLLLGSTLLISSALLASAPAYAQETVEEEVATVETTPPVVEDESDDTEVIVTGSRLRKSTFNSITPLQIIDTDVANEEGLFNPVEILQSSSAAGGQQIDSTFQGFVLDNGPGSETVDLRGLGASRTLVLLNGRRVSPAGVEGAPSQVSINLIPRTMVDQYDLLLDGASSVYGSDAVAGVLNVVLKNDFDGLELSAEADTPETGQGQDFTIGARYGINADRGFIGGAVEYTYQDPWTTNDRDFLAGCETYREITESGEIRTVDISDQFVANQLGLNAPTSECRPTRLTQRFIASDFGSIYYQPEINNTGIAGFSESTLFGVPLDGNGDGIVDVNFHEFTPNGQQDDVRQLVNEQNQISVMAIGEYTLEGEMNVTPYFEALHTSRDITAISQQPQLFPFVSGNNPFNPCNTLAGGVDCNQAYNAVLLSPEYQALFQSYYNNPNLGSANCFGIGDDPFCNPGTFGLLLPDAAQQTARPVVGVQGDRNVTEVELRQTHLVAGVRGDLPMINFADFKDWSFDLSAVHSYADGSSSRSGIRGDRLNFALGNSQGGAPVGNAPCDVAANPGLLADVIVGCVPVNVFAASLYQTANGGTFASQAETDYLFDSRDFDTHTALTTVDFAVQGDIFTLPGGDASLLLGVQWRKDHLNSQPDAVAADGLFFGFFSDEGGSGSRTTKEVYGEAFIPLGLGKTGFREFNVELAGRLTDDEFYGTNETYSAKAGYRPIDSLLVRGTYGTSFKAPNLRQLFLSGQTGFSTLGDPCAVPDAAYNALTMAYDPTQDLRSQVTLDNCTASGVDPRSFLAGQFAAYSVEVNSGGALDLNPEESNSYTLGFSFDQPFTDAFDLEFGATYYNIDIEQTIIEPSAAFIVSDCYSGQVNLGSAFCSRITRDFADVNNPGVIDLVDSSFINRAQETAKGVDYNMRFNKDDVAMFGTNVDFFGRLQANNNHSRTTVDIDANGNVDAEQLKKAFGFPKWRGNATVGFTMDRWSAAWTTRYQTEVTIDEEFIPTFGAGTTCLGVDNGGVDCRPVFSADDYWLHSLSATYAADDWNILVGVSNVFNTAPPLVDPSQVFSVVNVPIGSGYDLNGREYFVRVRKTF